MSRFLSQWPLWNSFISALKRGYNYTFLDSIFLEPQIQSVSLAQPLKDNQKSTTIHNHCCLPDPSHHHLLLGSLP